MKLYPIMLLVEGRQTAVVGGGQVALRKVHSLLQAGAKVRMVTEDAPNEADLLGVEVIVSRYSAEHLAGAALVYACTNDAAVNAQIAADAREAGAIVNCVDQPEDCDFFVPAVVADGEVIVAIGTGGASPALAARLKECVRAALPEQIGEFASLLVQIRDQVKDRVDDVGRRGKILKTLASEPSYQAFLAGGPDAVARILHKLISRDSQ